MNGPNTNIRLNLSENTFDTQVNVGFIYNNYITQLEKEMALDRRAILAILALSMGLFALGRYEILVTYVITAAFPIKWGLDSYNKNDDTFVKIWGTYATAFLVFFVFDCASSWVIKVLPLYFFIRTAVLLWMYLPCFKGAITLYEFVFIEGKRFLELMAHKPEEEDKETMLAELKEKYKLKTD